LVTGAGGQLGQALLQYAPEGWKLRGCDRSQLDITNAAQVHQVVAEFAPTAIINAAAYTAVDKAESEPELARAINALGAENMARAAAEYGARIIQISTDFVFDGQRSTPYPPDAPTNPLNVYGQTKCEGEERVRAAAGELATILRTAWVYGPVGHNFMLTMLRLLQEREELRVVSDQVGTPTSTRSIAGAVYHLLAENSGAGSTLHWTDAGVASWYDFASVIRAQLIQQGSESVANIHPIPTSAYPTPAQRPSYSVLARPEIVEGARSEGSNEGFPQPQHWMQEFVAVRPGYSATE
jgi:dTDP-4-dehydrorhamnose reductase